MHDAKNIPVTIKSPVKEGKKPHRIAGRTQLYAPYLYTGRLPARIHLFDASLPGLDEAKAFHAFYGRRPYGFMAARHYCNSNGGDYSALEIGVQFDHPISQYPRQIEDLADHRILFLHLITSGFAIQLDDRLRKDLGMRQIVGERRTLYSLMHTLQERPDAIVKLLEYRDLEHIQMLVHLAHTDLYPDPLPVATIPRRHLDCIVEARSRFDPKLIIDLR